MNIRQIFEKGNAGLGWAALWRLALILVPLNFLAELAAIEASANPAGAVAMLLALPVGGNVYLVPIAIPIVLFAWNWIGKYVMEQKLGVRPARFVGWSLYWRVAVLQLAGIFALTLVVLPMTFLARSAGDRTQMVILSVSGLVLLPALIYWSLNVAGFVLRRVARLVPVAQTLTGRPTEGGPVLVRSYQALFDPSRFGMNWMFAAAYPVAGLLSFLTYPLVDALFTEGSGFGFDAIMAVFVLSWIVSGLGLAYFLHKLRSAWQVIVAFVVLLLVLRPVESLLVGVLPGASDALPLDAQALISRACFAALFAGGLLAGIRFIGPGILGLGVGTGLATLIQVQFVYPLLFAYFHEIPLADLWSPLRFGQELLRAVLEAAINGAAFWWACDRHLKRQGLRLTQRGVIEPRRRHTVT